LFKTSDTTSQKTLLMFCTKTNQPAVHHMKHCMKKLKFSYYFEILCQTIHISLPVSFFCPWLNGPQWARASPLSRIHGLHSDTPQSVGFLWTDDWPYAQTSTWKTLNTRKRRTFMPPMGFEPVIPSKQAAVDPRLR